MARKPKKYHYIYKTTCKITGKFYVGMHSTDNLEDGYLGSGKILGYSRRKYGDENHVREILEFCSSRHELKQREKEIVCEELLADPLNINLKYGGEGGWEHLNNGSDSHRLRCSKGGKLKHRNLSEEQSKHLMEKWRRAGQSASGKINGPRTIKYATAAARLPLACKKRSITMKLRGSQLGERNSQFGTCWVTMGTKSIKIKKDHLEEYLMQGYSRGRKIPNSCS